MDAVKLIPPFPLNVEIWEDGRTWEHPPIYCLRCWLFGHKAVREFSDDLRWFWDRCVRCGVRGHEEKTDLRYLELWGRRIMLTTLEQVPDAVIADIQKGIQ